MNETSNLPEMPPLAGVDIATFASGIGYAGRPDILMVRLSEGTQTAGVLTRNTLAAAPVVWTLKRLADGTSARVLVINAGNANCYTGPAGAEVVARTAERAAGLVGCAAEDVLICSTGNIGQPIDGDTMEAALDQLAQGLAPDNWHDAARAIMTTDRWPKAAVRHIRIGDETVHLYGITKGTSMIAPDMATTISAVFTDAAIPAHVLRAALTLAADATYNCISVDETTSTNDSLLLFATGQGVQHQTVNAIDDEHFQDFRHGLGDLLLDMSQQLLADARKDGKQLTVQVKGASSLASARTIGRQVSRSMMVRRLVQRGEAARSNGQPTASRIIAAIGAAGEPVAADKLSIHIADVPVAEGGQLLRHTLSTATERLQQDLIVLTINVGVGTAQATIWTTIADGEG